MKITTRKRDGVTILDLDGSITIDGGDVALREAIQKAIDDGESRVLLNMARVKEVGSSGIGELMASFREISGRGGSMKLYALRPKVGDVLQVTELLTVLEILETEEEGVNALLTPPA